MDLDLNQEPLYSHDSMLELAALRTELENTQERIEERIRQLEAVTFRARQRQRWRQSHITPRAANVSAEPAVTNAHSDGRLRNSEVDVATEERKYEMGRLGKRNSSYLVAKALGRDVNGKKARSDKGSFFDCNICLDTARDPILTCCGHLFCWPCFYQLSYVYSNAKECPVCMEEVMDTSIIPIYGNRTSIPIYGNGTSNDSTNHKLMESGLKVPPRPPAHRIESVRQQLINRGMFSHTIEERMRLFGNMLIAMGERSQPEDSDGAHVRSERTGFLANRSSTSHVIPLTEAEGSQHHHSLQFSRLLLHGAASLSSLSSAVNSAERLVEDLDALLHSHHGRRNPQQSSRAADRDSSSSIAAVIQPDSQNLDTIADADSTVPHSASSLRTDDGAAVAQLESQGMDIESSSTVPSSSRRRNEGSRAPEADDTIERNSTVPHCSSSRRRNQVSRVSDADNGHLHESRRRRLS